MQGIVALGRRGQLWGRFVRGPARFAVASALLVGLVGLALVSRRGTDWAINTAWALAALAVVLVMGALVRSLRQRKDPAALLRSVLIPIDAHRGHSALRALSLVRAAQAGASAGASGQEHGVTLLLAQLHFERSVQKVSEAEVKLFARRRARQYRLLGAGFALLFLATNLLRSREIAEGLNLLATRSERAPLAMHWVERLVISARPPAYLRMRERRVLSGGRTVVPVGTELTLRALALFGDRQLVVTDGTREEKFASDGSGGLVAHFTVTENVRLAVAARFGSRLILENQGTIIVAKPDRAPRVKLEGAPRTQSLADVKRLPLRWVIEDDHGLRQVDLVLRSGYREERRSLSYFEAETTRHQGGTVLRADDEFLKTLFLPTEIRVEARDNYPLGDEPQWGQSEPIVVVPTAVGEPEALRYRALTLARDRFVATLAAPKLGNSSRAQQVGALDSAVWLEALDNLSVALSKNYAGLSVPSGLRAFIEGRIRWVQERARQKGNEQAVHSVENLVLSLDDALSQLARRDAQSVAKLLATVADEAQARAQWVSAPETPSSGEERLAESIYALESGIAQLLMLGRLGQDLGTVAMASLGRIGTANTQRDWFHVALAAQHLAERLRRPNPSFGAKGAKLPGSSSGGPSSGSGGESQGAPDSDSQGSASGSEQKGDSSSTQPFDQLARQIAELARQHAGVIESVAQTVRVASGTQATEPEIRARAQRMAKQLRDSVEPLPLPGHLPGSVEAIASLAREHSRAMSHGLEGFEFEQALKSGRSARAAFEKALEQSRSKKWLSGQLSTAFDSLQESLQWLQEQVRIQRRTGRQQARSALSGTAALETQLAGLTGELARRGQDENTSLPQAVIDRLQQARVLMRQAARSLSGGQGNVGLEHQRQAQRLLEQADRGETKPAPDSGESGSEKGVGLRSQGSVPDEGAEDPAAEFRRRVLENLGAAKGGNLAPAIQRYAEGLLN